MSDTPPAKASADAHSAATAIAARFANALPWVSALIAVLAILAIGLLDRREHEEIARRAAQAELERIILNTESRIDVHTAALRSAAAAVAGFDRINEERWSRLIRGLADEDRLAGTTAIGYARIAGGRATIESLTTLSATDRLHADTVRVLEGDAIVKRLRADRIGPPRLVALNEIALDMPGVGEAAEIIVPVLRAGHDDQPELVGFVFSHFNTGRLIEQLLRDLPRQGRLAVITEEMRQPATTVYADAGYNPSASQLERRLRIADTALNVRLIAGEVASGQPRHRLWFATLIALAILATLAGPALRSVIAEHLRNSREHEAEVTVKARERAERLESVFAVAPDALIAIDSAGQITDFNPAAEHLFRLKPAAALGKSIDELMPDCGFERIRSAVSGGNSPFDTSSRRARLQGLGVRRGGQFPVEVNVGQLGGENGQYVCAVRDITEQRRTEEEMRLYKRAISSSSNAVIISDVTLPDQPIIYVNPAFERMTGYDLADAFGRNCRFLQGPDTDASAVAKMRAAIARGADCNVILKNYTKDRTPFWNQITLAPVRDRNGKVTHYVGIETDVTERMQTEAALEERRRQLDAIFNLSPDGFVAFATDRRVTYVNPAFLRITRLELEDVQGASIDQLDTMLAVMKDPKHAWKPLGQALEEANEATSQPGAALTSSGNATPELMYLRNPATKIVQRSLRRSAAGATEFVLYLRDVTRELEVDRMKSEFLSSAAHELRTPMASIFGFAELLLRKKYPEERQREMIDTIHRQAKHLTNLVNELLDLARIEARAGKDFKLEEQPLAPMIQDAVAALLMPNDTRKVEMNLPENMPQVRVDSGKLRQALTNILSNAYKYSPQGGRIRLTIEERRGPDRDFVGVRVSDEGIGMTPEQLAHACERFYRADTSGNIPGTGLGLSLVKEIMQVQGGSIDLASEYGKGTTVTLWMPISSREVRTKAA